MSTGEGSQGPSLLSGRVTRLSSQALFNTIKNGLPGTTIPEPAHLRTDLVTVTVLGGSA